uniref:PAP-associated domain-containing protein n=1 Tax=Anopheles farauti TaxID=69004 RepID=A0A182Q6J4_9DIPT
MAKIHDALKPIQWLIGTWKSISAKGSFPTIKDFTYSEVITFESLGQPLLNYESRSQHPQSGAPMHLERGFLRIKPGTNQVAFMVAHNFGLAVLEEGEATDNGLKLASKSIDRMSFGKDPAVRAIEKRYRLNGDGTLEIQTDMQTDNTPMTNHLIVVSTYNSVEHSLHKLTICTNHPVVSMGRTKVRKAAFSHCPNITMTLNSNGSVKLKTFKSKTESTKTTPLLRSTGSMYESFSEPATYNHRVQPSLYHVISAYPSDPHPLRSHLRYFSQQASWYDGRANNCDKYKYSVDFLNNVRHQMYSERGRKTPDYCSNERIGRSDETHHTLANLLRRFDYHNNYLENNLCYYTNHTEYKQRRRNRYLQEQGGHGRNQRENKRSNSAFVEYPGENTHSQSTKTGYIENRILQASEDEGLRITLEKEDTSLGENSRREQLSPREHSSESIAPLPTSPTCWLSESLSQEIWQMFLAAKQTDETFSKKMKLWQTLYSSFQQMSPWFPKYELYLMGSTISGFGTDSSDMDMCIVDINGPMYCDTRTEALNNLLRVKNFIESMRSMSFEQIVLIRAKVPILRFHSRQDNIDIDLSINNRVGIRNTHLLNCYAQLDVRVRPLVVIVKLWALHHSLNDPKNSTMSSYSLVLMVINFLQCGVRPAVLPCLHSMHPEKFSIDNFPNNLLERIDPYHSENNNTLGELLTLFYKHYAEFDYTNYAISVRTGTLLPVEKCTWNENSRSGNYLCIEECQPKPLKILELIDVNSSSGRMHFNIFHLRDNL